MIELTRLNGTLFFVNPDLVYTLEATPDTVVTLTNGEKLVIRETPEEVVNRFVAFKRRVFEATPSAEMILPASS